MRHVPHLTTHLHSLGNLSRRDVLQMLSGAITDACDLIGTEDYK